MQDISTLSHMRYPDVSSKTKKINNSAVKFLVLFSQ